MALWPRSLDLYSGSLLHLIVDFIFFLICALDPPDHGIWLTALFFLYILASASLFHQTREVIVVSSFAMLYFLIVGHDQPPAFWPALTAPALLAFALSLQKTRLQERLFVASRQAVMYRSEAERSREAERQRIAADFHDGPLQSFISFQMRLEIVKKLMARNQQMAFDELSQLQELCKTQIADLRAFVRSMRLQDTEGASLATSIRKVVEDFQKTTGVNVNLVTDDSIGNTDPDFSHEVLQIVREALNNVQKHSRATRVAIGMERRGDVLEISVDDDGGGFPFGGSYNLDELEQLRMGPGSIKRRVKSLSGELTLVSNPGRGTALRVRLAL